MYASNEPTPPTFPNDKLQTYSTTQNLTPTNPTSPHVNDDLPLNPETLRFTLSISKILAKLIPTLSYQICNEISTERNEEAAANAALAWYNQQCTKSATAEVITALDAEPSQSPETLQNLIDKTVNKALDKKVAHASKNITKNIEKKP